MDLHDKVIGNFSGVQILSFAAGAIVLLFLFRTLKGMMNSQTPGKYEERRKCTACGWVGVVPKFKPACRKCGNTSLQAVR